MFLQQASYTPSFGGLGIGLTQEAIIEVFIQTAFYGGLPFTRAAMDIANEIFRAKSG